MNLGWKFVQNGYFLVQNSLCYECERGKNMVENYLGDQSAKVAADSPVNLHSWNQTRIAWAAQYPLRLYKAGYKRATVSLDAVEKGV